MAKKAKKRFSRAISIKKCSKLLEILANMYNFSLRVEWRKRQASTTLLCWDMGSRNEHAQNLALCQVNEFYAEKYFPEVVLCIEFISDILKVRWIT